MTSVLKRIADAYLRFRLSSIKLTYRRALLKQAEKGKHHLHYKLPILYSFYSLMPKYDDTAHTSFIRTLGESGIQADFHFSLFPRRSTLDISARKTAGVDLFGGAIYAKAQAVRHEAITARVKELESYMLDEVQRQLRTGGVLYVEAELPVYLTDGVSLNNIPQDNPALKALIRALQRTHLHVKLSSKKAFLKKERWFLSVEMFPRGYQSVH